MEKIRLDKLISNELNISRTDVKKLISKGRVQVNGAIAKTADAKVCAETDEITLDGERVEYNKYVYIMLNKPAGVVSASRDGKCKTVVDLVPAELYKRGLFPAGRLDKDTVGFVLLTNNGALAHDMLSPKNHVPKTYFTRVSGEFNEEKKAKLENGIAIDKGDVCKPARLAVLGKTNDGLTEIEIIITEGMYHQIKRMFEAVGCKVEYLRRIQIGALKLDENLAEGECRAILYKEVEKLLTRKI